MNKTYCDKCGKDITDNYGYEDYGSITIEANGKKGGKVYLQLCGKCYKEAVEESKIFVKKFKLNINRRKNNDAR